ncbi:hypothetical protein M406DRAFT_334267 [Cryphonectria parasitica EP155]|uniref:Uncharacterized protein n=1 Tax=Cryphonectria parasitica (strain ATCC 38755 / EP155) TaxID=660469 RepID=A0A9P5CKD8_CRYP1|nr:uncharacterized protein M406DRAFT_334267 [Cryphonectria parasitica EP155]KAF3760640.1 hypothetical protein M406DRAFT_334267 [Cryphonectria parasitica EP155]
MDGLNNFRTARVAEILGDFQNIQYYIAAAPIDPPNMDDYYTEGWATLRQCNLDGQRILNCGADTSVPVTSGGPDEQAKAELKQVLLDAYARRHEAQKIYLRQAAAQRWIECREQILMGGRPNSKNQAMLRQADHRLRSELHSITDETIYNSLQGSDLNLNRWTAEDPSLRSVQRWVRTRR